MSLFPRLALELNDVTFSNAPGSKQKHMATLSQLVLNLKLLPLLAGNVEVGTFILENPTIILEVDKNGQANWNFQADSEDRSKKSVVKSANDGSPIKLPMSDIRLGEVGIRNGSITYSDAKSGQIQKISQIHMSVSLPNLSSPFSAKGDATWNKKKVALETSASSLRSIIEGKDTNISAKLVSAPINLDFSGNILLKPSIRIGGQWSVQVPSVRNLAAG